jgi:diguanylate cyclase (GGDEF)-like protein
VTRTSEGQNPHRILVVDDNVAIHDDFRKILLPRSAGDEALVELEHAVFGGAVRTSVAPEAFRIDSAFQGAQAVEMVRTAYAAGSPYAVIFLDGRMPPGISGLETVPLIWAVDPRVQIVISSAYSDHKFSDIVGAVGHRDGLVVLRKPFDAIEVLQLTHALARKWSLSREVEERIEELEQTVQTRTRALEESNRELRREVEERMHAEEELRRLATHDPVTGIANRVLFRERVVEAVSRAKRRNETFALMLIDLDHFKEINDRFGHATGDDVLRALATRLRGCVRGTDVVARLGGDEFSILLDGLASPEEAAIIADRVLKSCAAPLSTGGHEVATPVSVGIAVFPSDCVDVEDLLKCADLALYEAKAAGRAGYRFYAEGMLRSSQEQLSLREDLSHAVERGELRLHYQPLVDLQSGTITAMEALVRWQHPARGLVPPVTFIPAAERNGMIVAIGRWVLRTACEQLGHWKRQGFGDLSVAVNVSAREVLEPDFVAFVISTLTEAGIEPGNLELELTESAAMEDPEHSAEVLGRLSAAGVRLAIDDFGSGYSSLMRLKQMPINVLKIDRFFVRDLARSPRDAAIVRTVVALAHSLGLTVVVEGIETDEQLRVLRELDWDQVVSPRCDRVQGYLLSRPLPTDLATGLLAGSATALKPTG